jgi:hypothetical protein
MKKLVLIIFILCIQFSNAQVGIGTSDPNKSAQLEVLSSEKGLLIPRIQLNGTTDVSTINNGNVESLLIYNTVNTSDVTKGFYYWGGTKWRKIVTEAIVNNLISEDNTLAEGKVYLGNGSDIGAEVSISGDATIANTGALTIANHAVTTVKILDGAITKTKLISTTTAADNGKVLAINSDGSALEWKVSSTGGVLFTEDFMEDNATPKAHSLTMTVLGTTANNFKVSLNGSVISPSNIAYDSSNGANGSIQITGIPVYNYDVVTVAYITNN